MRLPNASDYLRRSRDSQHNGPANLVTLSDEHKAMWLSESLEPVAVKLQKHFPLGLPPSSRARIMHHQIVVFTMHANDRPKPPNRHLYPVFEL